MSDDLVKMARLAQRDERMSTGALYGDLADRIEELEANINLKADFIDATINQLAASDQRIEELEAKLAKVVEALVGVLGACDEGRMIPRPGHGAGGMTIEANIKGSIYTGVPAWPIEEARTTLAELKGEDRG